MLVEVKITLTHEKVPTGGIQYHTPDVEGFRWHITETVQRNAQAMRHFSLSMCLSIRSSNAFHNWQRSELWCLVALVPLGWFLVSTLSVVPRRSSLFVHKEHTHVNTLSRSWNSPAETEEHKLSLRGDSLIGRQRANAKGRKRVEVFVGSNSLSMMTSVTCPCTFERKLDVSNVCPREHKGTHWHLAALMSDEDMFR